MNRIGSACVLRPEYGWYMKDVVFQLFALHCASIAAFLVCKGIACLQASFLALILYTLPTVALWLADCSNCWKRILELRKTYLQRFAFIHRPYTTFTGRL